MTLNITGQHRGRLLVDRPYISKGRYMDGPLHYICLIFKLTMHVPGKNFRDVYISGRSLNTAVFFNNFVSNISIAFT